MLTFLVVCIAVIAAIQLVVKCIYGICVWVTAFSSRWVAERKKPKPPLPPKPNLKSKTQDGEASVAKESLPDQYTSEVPDREETIQVEVSNNKTQERNVTNEAARMANGSASSSKVTPQSGPQATTRGKAPLIRSGSFSEGINTIPTVNQSSAKLRGGSPQPQRKTLDHMAREESIESVEEDICCSNFTTLISQKAKGFSQPYSLVKRGRSPPAKPPKPSAEALALAKGRTTSFGDDIPVGVDGFKYADDTETEPSLDYKDVIFDKGRVVAAEKPMANEGIFDRLVRRLTPSPRPSPPPSPSRRSPLPPPEINIETFEDEVFSNEMTTNEIDDDAPINYQIFPDLVIREKPAKPKTAPSRYQTSPTSTAMRNVPSGRTDSAKLRSSPSRFQTSSPSSTTIRNVTSPHAEPAKPRSSPSRFQTSSPSSTTIPNVTSAHSEPAKPQSSPSRFQSFPSSVLRKVTGGYSVSDSESFGGPEARRTWPAAKRNRKGKIPPARPPPPKNSVYTKTVCFSDDETSIQRRQDHLLLSEGNKPSRPPPPRKPVRFAPLPDYHFPNNTPPQKIETRQQITSSPLPPLHFDEIPVRNTTTGRAAPSKPTRPSSPPARPPSPPARASSPAARPLSPLARPSSPPTQIVSSPPPPPPPPPVSRPSLPAERPLSPPTRLSTSVISFSTPTKPVTHSIHSSSPPDRTISLQFGPSFLDEQPISDVYSLPSNKPLPLYDQPPPYSHSISQAEQNMLIHERTPSPITFVNTGIMQDFELETGPSFMQRRVVPSSNKFTGRETAIIAAATEPTHFATVPPHFATVPRPPPRQRRERSRTVEITNSEWRQSLPEVHSKRRTLSADRDKQSNNNLKPDTLSEEVKTGAALKSLYTQVNKHPPHSSSTVSLPGYVGKERTSVQDPFKFKFRPLPPPPAPPRNPRRSSLRRSVPTDSSQVLSSPSEDNIIESYQSRERSNNFVSPSAVGPTVQIQQRDENANIQESPSTLNNSSLTSTRFSPKAVEAKVKHRSKSDVHSPAEDLSRKNKRRSTGTSRFYCDSPSSDVSSHLPVKGQIGLSTSSTPMRFEQSPERAMDDGGHYADIDSSVTSSRQTSVERSNTGVSQLVWSSRYKRNEEKPNGKKNRASRSSVFYCDFPAELENSINLQVPLPKVKSEPKQSRSLQVDHSAQTSPDVSVVPTDNAAEDSDELMDIANNLRRELNTILQRHKPGVANPVTPRTIKARMREMESDISSTGESHNGEYLKRMASKKSNVSIGSARSSEASWHASSEESEEETSSSSAGQPKMSAEEKQYRKLFYIAREIMTSEEAFVDVLRLLNVDFQGAVRRASIEKGSNIVPDEILMTLFGYLPQLQHLNEKLLSEFKERLERWDEIQKISDIVVEIGPFLKLYSSYIRNFDHMSRILDESIKKFPHFGQIVKEFEAGPQCQKLALKHFLLKPVQRIPQYRLLLQDYLNHLDEDSPDYDDTVKALKIVSEVADHANNTMKQGDNSSKLISIQNSLLTRHEIVKPGRVFLKEGELLKLSRKVPQPRMFILFNDSLLYLTPQQGMFKVNHELPLTGMKVSVPMQNDYRNEFSILSITRSFSLAAKSQQDRDDWVTALTHAIEENSIRRSSFINVQTQKGQLSAQESVLGEQAPVWIPDARVTMCQLCTTEFTITFRRHHCRACGRVVCSSCSANRTSLKYLNFRIVRVCNVCFGKLQQDFEQVLDSESSIASSTSDLRPQSTPNSTFLDPRRLRPVARSDSDSSADNRTPNRPGGRNRFVPERLKEVHANDQGSDISGYLHQLSKRTWKRYWFVLKSKVLYTYKASEDVAALKSIPLLGFQVEELHEPLEGVKGSLIFKLTHPGHPDLIFYAESVGSAERWIKVMKNATILE